VIGPPTNRRVGGPVEGRPPRPRMPRWIAPSAIVLVLLVVAAVAQALQPTDEATALPVMETATASIVPPEIADPFASLSPEALEWVERTLAGMTLRQRVAQMVMPWIPGGRIAPGSAEHGRLRRWIEQDGVGGLIVSRGAASEFGPAMNAAQAMAGVPLLIVSDLETGPGMRLTGGTNFPPAMAFGAAGDEELAREAGRITGREARAVGIHMTLGPVLDVNHNPRNPIINTRAFGEDPALVGRMAAAWMEGAREAGLLTAGKHFPGHGATGVDSHIGLPVIPASAGELEAVDLAPFRHAIARGMEGVLVGHLAVAAIDGPNAPPASISPGVVTGLLRERIGFRGLVITDALNMGAITRRHPVPEASIRAILAGADVLLQPPGERAVIDAVVAAVESGRIPAARIDESARRILATKAAAGLHRGARVDAAAAGRLVGSDAHAAAVRLLADRSLTLVRDRAGLVPLPAEARRILHVTYGRSGSRFTAPTLTGALQGGGRTVQTVVVDDRTGAATYASLRERARAADLVVVSISVFPREYVGIELQPGFAAWVEETSGAGVPLVAVSFGTPYLLEGFPSVPAYLLAWSSTAASQRAAARALLGQTSVEGVLPVTLSAEHRAGSSVRRAVQR
jgi:beta-N-acetylhexosaminidase